MTYYSICETLEVAPYKPAGPYVTVMTVAEWQNLKDSFDMGIDLEMSLSEIYGTKAVVNYDSLTGTFSVLTGRISPVIITNSLLHWMKKA